MKKFTLRRLGVAHAVGRQRQAQQQHVGAAGVLQQRQHVAGPAAVGGYKPYRPWGAAC